jgi:hypothetical protein
LGLALSGSGTHTCAHLITSTVSDLHLDAHGTWGAIIALAGRDRLHLGACGARHHLHLDACGALNPISTSTHVARLGYCNPALCNSTHTVSLSSPIGAVHGAVLLRCSRRSHGGHASSTDRRYLPLLHSLSHITHTMGHSPSIGMCSLRIACVAACSLICLSCHHSSRSSAIQSLLP